MSTFRTLPEAPAGSRNPKWFSSGPLCNRLDNFSGTVDPGSGVVMTSRCCVFLSVLCCIFPAYSSAQTIVSAHSGVVHFFEGAVSIDGRALEQKFGRFDELKPGSELRTDRGRAEVLLTPGVLL